MSDPHQQVVSADAVDPETHEHGQRTFLQRRLGHAAGGRDLGASRYELAPGKRTWPAHYHAGNEEAVYVLAGELRLFHGETDRTEHRLSAGDYVALPTGPAHAHELEAAGEGTARFLVVSTMTDPDIAVLPDGRTVSLFAGDPPGEYEGRSLSRTLDLDAEVDYWDDTTEAEASGVDADDTGTTDASGVDADDTRRASDDGTRGDGSDHARADSSGDPADGGETAAPVVSGADLEWTEYDPPREGHRFRRTQLGAPAGGRDLGASRYELPPGKRAWLPHYHAGNEEAMYVLDGEGTVTLGPDRENHALSAGDYVALPAGEAGFHDVHAGESTLRYLMVSTMTQPDITVYPEDGTVGLYAGSAPGGDSDARTISRYLDSDAEVDYWTG